MKKILYLAFVFIVISIFLSKNSVKATMKLGNCMDNESFLYSPELIRVNTTSVKDVLLKLRVVNFANPVYNSSVRNMSDPESRENITGVDGVVNILVSKGERVVISKRGFRKKTIEITEDFIKSGYLEVEVERLVSYKIYCIVKNSKEYLEGVSIQLLNEEKQVLKKLVTGTNGVVVFDSYCDLEYSLRVVKRGYKTKYVDIKDGKHQRNTKDFIINLDKEESGVFYGHIRLPKIKEVKKSHMIRYDSRSWILNRPEREKVKKVADCILSSSTARVILKFYDSVAKDLIEKRYDALYEYLIMRGVSPEKIGFKIASTSDIGNSVYNSGGKNLAELELLNL